jgi:hypothetical protein
MKSHGVGDMLVRNRTLPTRDPDPTRAGDVSNQGLQGLLTCGCRVVKGKPSGEVELAA